jgi:hypothetical protein
VVRLPCGHYGDERRDGACQECEDEYGASPDPWEVVQDPDRLFRLERARAIRQTKRRAYLNV